MIVTLCLGPPPADPATQGGGLPFFGEAPPPTSRGAPIQRTAASQRRAQTHTPTPSTTSTTSTTTAEPAVPAGAGGFLGFPAFQEGPAPNPGRNPPARPQQKSPFGQ